MVDLSEILDLVESGEDVGVCTACGHQQSAEPDASGHECEECGRYMVNGAEELLLDGFF